MILQMPGFSAKSNKLVYHGLFWLLAGVFWVFFIRNGALALTRTLTTQFCYLILIAANYYLNSLCTIPYLLNKKKYAGFAVCFLLATVVFAALRVPISVLINTYVFNAGDLRFNYLLIFRNSFINIVFWSVIFLTGKLLMEKMRLEIRIEQIEKEKSTNELSFLQTQFSPHFLFNSINTIYAHIDKANKQARNMLLVFSDMLRYQLQDSNTKFIDLDKELNYIRNYLEMQKGRIDDRVKVTFYTGKTDGSFKIAPSLLTVFVENAFEYVGYNENKENRIDICLTSFDGLILFTVINTKDEFIRQAKNPPGSGIADVKQQLALLYPYKHELTVIEKDESFEIILILAST